MFIPEQHPHRRFNPLTNEWVLVSPHRTLRPWQGQRESSTTAERPSYDPKCYLCPGNERAGGHRNAAYTSTFVFQNDFSALLPDTPISAPSEDPLHRIEAASGECRVICFSPRHDLTLAEMPVEGIRSVVDLWASQNEDLGRKYKWVQIFENKGQAMGCSNPHPHGQIWASSHLPEIPSKEDAAQRTYADQHGRSLLLDVREREISDGKRVVATNEDWLIVVPFWAVWPFELLVLPKRHVLRIQDLREGERNSLATVLKEALIRYDNLFETSFPYSFGWHQAPNCTEDTAHWQLHAHIYPPLLRSATVRKFMVGFEMLGEPQRDITPEQAAQQLRDLPEVHYKQIKS